MFCANCGIKQNEGEKFCPNCGTKFEEPKMVKEEVSNDASKQATPLKENIKTENKEVEVKALKAERKTVVEHSQPKEQPKDAVKISEDKAIGNISANEVIEAQYIVEKGSTNNYNTKLNTIQRTPFIDEKDENSILKWAIRYELGLGVPVDADKAEELYTKINNGNNVLKLLLPNDKSKQSGIISDGYIVERIKLYDVEEERKEEYERERARRQKEQELEAARKEQEKILLQKKREQEEKVKKQEEEKKRKKEEEIKCLKKDTFKHKSDGFMEFSYIVKYISPDLENLIKEYNTKAEKHGYDKIIVDKELKLIKGKYKEKNVTGQGFVKGLSSFWRSCFLEVDFEDIIKECKKVLDV